MFLRLQVFYQKEVRNKQNVRLEEKCSMTWHNEYYSSNNKNVWQLCYNAYIFV